jgi:hypothetical protein
LWTWNVESCPRHFKKGEGKRDNNGRNEPNWGTLYTYMEMTQGNPLCNYPILIKTRIQMLFMMKTSKMTPIILKCKGGHVLPSDIKIPGVSNVWEMSDS